jgi:hypothetical protein
MGTADCVSPSTSEGLWLSLPLVTTCDFPLPAPRIPLPLPTLQVPFNIVNATVAYAVEDIVLGDLLYNKSVDFWWIDWQQGGTAGGMVRRLGRRGWWIGW